MLVDDSAAENMKAGSAAAAAKGRACYGFKLAEQLNVFKKVEVDEGACFEGFLTCAARCCNPH